MIRLNGSRGLGIGEIARTKNTTGSIEIDPNEPYFAITDLYCCRLNAPAIVHKVGQRTGWTFGQIVNHCYDSRVPGGAGTDYVWIICENITDYNSNAGDSGAPVFVADPDYVDPDMKFVRVVGIHTGGMLINGVKHARYSAHIGYESDHRVMKWAVYGTYPYSYIWGTRWHY